MNRLWNKYLILFFMGMSCAAMPQATLSIGTGISYSTNFNALPNSMLDQSLPIDSYTRDRIAELISTNCYSPYVSIEVNQRFHQHYSHSIILNLDYQDNSLVNCMAQRGSELSSLHHYHVNQMTYSLGLGLYSEKTGYQNYYSPTLTLGGEVALNDVSHLKLSTQFIASRTTYDKAKEMMIDPFLPSIVSRIGFSYKINPHTPN